MKGLLQDRASILSKKFTVTIKHLFYCRRGTNRTDHWDCCGCDWKYFYSGDSGGYHSCGNQEENKR